MTGFFDKAYILLCFLTLSDQKCHYIHILAILTKTDRGKLYFCSSNVFQVRNLSKNLAFYETKLCIRETQNEKTLWPLEFFVYNKSRQPVVRQMAWAVFYPKKHEYKSNIFNKKNHFLSWLAPEIFPELKGISL